MSRAQRAWMRFAGIMAEIWMVERACVSQSYPTSEIEIRQNSGAQQNDSESYVDVGRNWNHVDHPSSVAYS